MSNTKKFTQYVDFVDDNEFYPSEPEGLDSLYIALEGVDFPISREELIEAVGDREIYWDDEETVMLEDLLRQLPQEVFSSVSDISAAISALSDENELQPEVYSVQGTADE